MQIDNKYFKKIIKSVGDSSSSKICKKIELLESANLISKHDAFLLKSDLKNIVHDSFREVKNHILCWQHGYTYNKLNTPTNTEE